MEDERYGQGLRGGRRPESLSGRSAQEDWRWDRWDRDRAPRYAEPQGDGEPYGDRQRDFEPSGGPARWSDEGERWPSFGASFSRGSRVYDGYEREPQERSPRGSGYGGYDDKEEYSPRGRSVRGGDGTIGAGGLDQFETPSRWGHFGGPGAYGFRESFGQGSGSSSAMPRGRFSGKGPKGYQRSDERIREDVGDVLERHGDLDASEIEVQVSSGEVTLGGTVPDRSSKRLAEDLVEDLPGVKHVDNRLRVGRSSPEKPNEAGKDAGSRDLKAGSNRSS